MKIYIESTHQTKKHVLGIRSNLAGIPIYMMFRDIERYYLNIVFVCIIEYDITGFIDIFRRIDIQRHTLLWEQDDYVMSDGEIYAFPSKFRHLEDEDMLSMMRRLNIADEQLNEFDD